MTRACQVLAYLTKTLRRTTQPPPCVCEPSKLKLKTLAQAPTQHNLRTLEMKQARKDVYPALNIDKTETLKGAPKP